MKVGVGYLPGKNKLRLVSYKDVKCEDGWADTRHFLPADFDLMTMKLSSGKEIVGWIQGDNWEGARLKDDDEVFYWKRKLNERDHTWNYN